MNRDEIIRRLKALPYDPEEFWILQGAAKVMRGIEKGAGAISLGCIKEMADRLEAEGVKRIDQERYRQRVFRIAKDVFAFENYLFGGFDVIEGFMVINVPGLQTMDEFELRCMKLDPDNMIEFRTEHFVFHFPVGSKAEQDIQQISERQEKVYRSICDTLRVEPDYPIHYHLFESPSRLSKIYGKPAYGFFRVPDSAFAVYCDLIDETKYHETVHVISWLLGNPSHAVKEGLAVWFDRDWAEVSNMAWVVWFLAADMYVNIENLLDSDQFEKYSGNLTYPLMGAFTEWLISTEGIDKYLEFYRYRDSEEGLREVYRRNASELNKMFVEYVKNYRLSDEEKVRFDSALRRKTGKTYYNQAGNIEYK